MTSVTCKFINSAFVSICQFRGLFAYVLLSNQGHLYTCCFHWWDWALCYHIFDLCVHWWHVDEFLLCRIWLGCHLHIVCIAVCSLYQGIVLCVYLRNVAKIYLQDYTRMHGQQNIKKNPGNNLPINKYTFLIPLLWLHVLGWMPSVTLHILKFGIVGVCVCVHTCTCMFVRMHVYKHMRGCSEKFLA
jgi:hypothetical protein